MTKTDNEETHSPEETVERREAALKRMLATPHQKQKPLGKRLPKARGATAEGAACRTTAPSR